MTSQVKFFATEYFKSIGGIESVDKKYRFSLKKVVLATLITIEENSSWDKLKTKIKFN